MKGNCGLSPRPGAVVIHGKTQNCRGCRLIDNTASVSLEDPQRLLSELVRNKRFGPYGLSEAGGNTINFDRPKLTHLQGNEQLDRRILLGDEAYFEEF